MSTSGIQTKFKLDIVNPDYVNLFKYNLGYMVIQDRAKTEICKAILSACSITDYYISSEMLHIGDKVLDINQYNGPTLLMLIYPIAQQLDLKHKLDLCLKINRGSRIDEC